MAQYFAEIKNGIVQRVIVADQAFIDFGVGDSSNWIETFESNLAGIGNEYHADLKTFVYPQQFPSWTLDKNLKQYVAPVEKPLNEISIWNEKTLSWEIVAYPFNQPK